jgi:uncharacterized protein (DUF2345 family)
MVPEGCRASTQARVPEDQREAKLLDEQRDDLQGAAAQTAHRSSPRPLASPHVALSPASIERATASATSIPSTPADMMPPA